MKTRGAYSLMEVVFAFGILAAMIVALLELFIAARASNEGGGAFAEAASVANGELNRAKVLPYDTLVGYVAAAPPSYSVTDTAGVPYNVTLTVTHVDSNPASLNYPLLDLQLETTWVQKQTLGTGAANGAAKSLHFHSVVGPSNSY